MAVIKKYSPKTNLVKEKLGYIEVDFVDEIFGLDQAAPGVR